MEKMYHVGFDDTHGAKYVILPGDPGRVEKIAQFLDEPHFYCQHREYTTWLGKVDGETVMVMSTGMGGPSTAIGVEECYKTVCAPSSSLAPPPASISRSWAAILSSPTVPFVWRAPPASICP